MKQSFLFAVISIHLVASVVNAQTQDDFEAIKPRVKWRFDVGFSSGPITVTPYNVLVGTALADPDRGRMLCLTRLGSEVWHADHANLPARINDMGVGIHSKPAATDDRVYYYSNRGEIICADIHGFANGENDGPFQEETSVDRNNVDILWKVDLIREYGVFKRDAGDIMNPHPSVLLDGGTLYCMTGNGARYSDSPQAKLFTPAPNAPSLIALDASTGELRWSHSCDPTRIRHGQWGSPSLFTTSSGEKHLAYCGGDAILYSLDPITVDGKVDWQTELEPAHGKGFSSGRPCAWEDLLLVGLGRECDDTAKFSIVAVTREGKVAWRFTHPKLHGCIGSIAVKDGVAFAYSNNTALFALDARTGALHTHKQISDSCMTFLSPVLVGKSLLVSSPDGLYEFTADKALTPLRNWDSAGFENDPVVVGNEIFVMDGKELICAEWEQAK